MSDLITARTPSVVVTNTSGMVGAPSKVRIRGVNSAILNNDPVIIVDGVRLVSQNTGGLSTSSLNVGSQLLSDAIATASTGTRLAPSRFDDLDPNSIESIGYSLIAGNFWTEADRQETLASYKRYVASDLRRQSLAMRSVVGTRVSN
jgi:hypothetical protein